MAWAQATAWRAARSHAIPTATPRVAIASVPASMSSDAEPPTRIVRSRAKAQGLSWAPGSVAPSAPSAWRSSPSASSSAGGGRRATIRPEEVSYSVVIASCTRRGDARGAAHWLQEMADSRSPCRPNVFAFNAVIAGFARKGSAAEAVGWLDRMIAEGLEPNVMSYTAVIDACAKAGDPDGAARWFHTMLENGVKPNTLSYNAVINSFARLGDYDGAKLWLERMRSDMALDIISYNSAIHCCANAHPTRAEEAESFFRELRAAELRPTVSTLTALERAVGAHRKEALCSELNVDVERALRYRPPPEHRRGPRPIASSAGLAEKPWEPG